jgi:hypothetical protein
MKKPLVIAFFCIIGAYALFQARFLIIGPGIEVYVPTDNSSVQVGVIEISGSAKNTSYLSLDDREIYRDTSGEFSEKVVIHEGVNIIKLYGRNKFGREKTLLINVLGVN